MPHNIYDNTGRKVGEIRSAGEEAAGLAFFIVFILPALVIIGAIIAIITGFVNVFWEWAKTIHHLTPYGNLNGVITLVVIPAIAFVLTARWERIVSGAVSVKEEIWRVIITVYAAILGFCFFAGMSDEPYPQNFLTAMFFGLPIAVSSFSFLRFKPVKIIVALLIGIPLAIVGIGLLILIIGAIVVWLIGWLTGG